MYTNPNLFQKQCPMETETLMLQKQSSCDARCAWCCCGACYPDRVIRVDHATFTAVVWYRYLWWAGQPCGLIRPAYRQSIGVYVMSQWGLAVYILTDHVGHNSPTPHSEGHHHTTFASTTLLVTSLIQFSMVPTKHIYTQGCGLYSFCSSFINM